MLWCLGCIFSVCLVFSSGITVEGAVVEESDLGGMGVETQEYAAPAPNQGAVNTEDKDKKKTAKKSGSLTLDNDGNARDTPYGDAKFPNSYEGADYYDCYVPYNLTCEEIGGYSTRVIAAAYSGTNYSMTQYPDRLKYKIATKTALYKSVAGFKCLNGSKVTAEPETGVQIVEDSNGAKYYTTAVQNFFYMFPGIAADKGFSSFEECRGQLVDVVLTDGTCIHFILNDANAIPHTNGGPAEATLIEVQWEYAPMKHPQYKNIFQAGNANMLELGYDRSMYGYGAASKWLAKYNIGEDGNKVAYYRMYNKRVSDLPKRAAGVGNEVSYSMGNASISSNGSGSSSESVGVGGSKIVKEWELAGMPSMSEIKASQTTLTLPSVDDLSVGDAYNVSVIRGNIEIMSKATAFERARVIVVFIGLMLELYAVLLLVAMLFDRVNVFLDISLVSTLTFGKLKYIVDEDVQLQEGMTNTKKLVISVVVVMVVGFLLISGSIFPFLGNLLYKVSQVFI